MISTEIKHGEDIIEQQNSDKIIIFSPPFLKGLAIAKASVYPNFDILGELKILCIKITLLQAI